jgi:3-hydroxyacyl-[acyl-carrier-protein] dehydratase
VILAQSTTTELTLSAPYDHACYADHFPGNPLVPGALLLKWIVALIEKECHCTIIGIKHMKFLMAIKPGDPLLLKLAFDTSATQFKLEVYTNNKIAMKGTVERNQIESVHD